MISVEDAIQMFILASDANGLSKVTVKWYAAMLKPMAAKFSGLALDAVPVADMRLYVVTLRNNARSVETVRGYMRALRRFWSWAESEYDLDPKLNPMRKIAMPKKPQQLPKAVSDEDLRAMFLATKPDLEGIRDRAILAFLTDTGCRSGGLRGLPLDRLDIKAGRALVLEKG